MGGGSRDSDDRRGGGGLGGLWLTTNLFRFDDFDSGSIVSYSKDQKPGIEALKLKLNGDLSIRLYFSHVFGDGDPNAEWDTILKKAFVAFVQTHKV